MRYFARIAEGVDVTPLLHAVDRQPDLWNAHRWRTTYTGTPHQAVDDIWLRFSDDSITSDVEKVEGVQADVTPVFHDAWHKLPQARSIVFDLMRRVEGYELGRVLITRLPPGGTILRHADADGAYVRSGCRYHVVLRGLPGSLYMCGDETVCMRTGEVWWFDHNSVHEVRNNSVDDRVHLLVDMRSAP